MDAPTKVQVHFTVGPRHESALFDRSTPIEQIKDLFLGAAESGPWDVVKLYDAKTGALHNIDNSLEPNAPGDRYELQMVAVGLGMIEDGLANEIQCFEARVVDLERRVNGNDLPLPPTVEQLKLQVDSFREKLETAESLCCLGFYKQLPEPLSTDELRRLRYRRKSDTIRQKVKQNFLNICDSEISDSVKEWLRMPTFDSRQWEDEELLLFLQQMYIDYDLCSKFAIDINTLRNFLFEAYKHYNEVPFHNFRHCFCVTQMMYAITWCVDLSSKIGDLEILILLTSCICHDLDHPGYNNIYQINARTELAIRYNDISPLENHHCSVAFRILEHDDCNIFKSFAYDEFKRVREGIIRCILATDMARHNEILSNFKEIVPDFDYTNKAHVNLLCMVLIKVSDISNEARPMDVADLWLDKLLQEFFKQSDAEKLEGLPVTPFMDRDRITKPSSQCSFIGLVLLPLFEALGDLLNELQELIIDPARHALDYYRRLNEATKEERMLHRKSIVSEMGDQGSLHSSTGVHVAKSGSSTSLRRSAHTSSRSHSEEDLEREEIIGEEEASTLEDVLEDMEEADKEPVTEVEVSERALKFKISTEGNVASSTSATTAASGGGIGGGHRKSCPSSRKGSRERVQHFSSTDIARAVQRSKLKTGALSFDQHCLMRGINKLSFDTPEFLDEYAIVRNNSKSEREATTTTTTTTSTSTMMNNGENNKYETLLSKETLDLNRRNTSKCDGTVDDDDDARSSSAANDDITNVDDVESNEDAVEANRRERPQRPQRRRSDDNLNSISVEHVSVKEDCENANKNTCSIFSRIKKITEQFNFTSSTQASSAKSNDKRYRNLRINLRNASILSSPCCRSLENIEDNNRSTSSNRISGWFFASKEPKTDDWQRRRRTSSSDADVYKLATTTSSGGSNVINNRNDNHRHFTASLPSTSKTEHNCYGKPLLDKRDAKTSARANKTIRLNAQSSIDATSATTTTIATVNTSSASTTTTT